MTDRATRQSRKQRRQELIAQANRERQEKGVGSELTGPQGVGAPRATGSDVPASQPTQPGPRKLPLPD